MLAEWLRPYAQSRRWCLSPDGHGGGRLKVVRSRAPRTAEVFLAPGVPGSLHDGDPARVTHPENSLGVGRIASISQRSRHAAGPSTPRSTRRIVKQQASPTAATGTKLKTDGFNGVKVFSATMVAQRESLGGVVTAWIAEHSHFEIIDIVVTQSSDSSFHCIAISVFYSETVATLPPGRRLTLAKPVP